jgi:endogenous inhibitor of DNA gyrase (YacG/DUF329 family)
MESICTECNKKYNSPNKNSKFCSRKCYYLFRKHYYVGEKSPQWRGGTSSFKKRCKTCGDTFVGNITRTYCSLHCKAEDLKMIGEKNGMWKGGRTGGNGKYIFILKPEHPNAINGGYVQEHRLKMEKKIGRFLTKDEVVHHKNENKSDNRLCNLKLMSKTEHDLFHNKKRSREMFLGFGFVNCQMCGLTIKRKIAKINFYQKNNLRHFCSHQCSGRFGSNLYNQPKKVINS